MNTLIRIMSISIFLISVVSGLGIAAPKPGAATDAESSAETAARLKWWREARFGMFIHWGPVSLKGTEIGWSRGKQVPLKEYDNLYRKFNPVKFSGGEWARTAKSAGMKYMVLTAKHHDGFCLWDTATTSYDILSTPYGKDVVKELAEACRKEGITFCTYYSILDWYHPDYNVSSRGGPGYRLPAGQTASMDRYEKYMKTHLRELIEKYGPLGVMWFDGEWEKPWTHERGAALYRYVRTLQPDIIVNNRVDKGRKGMHGSTRDPGIYKGDFDTPEQRVGTFQTDRPWETCMTICRQWAWKPGDRLKSLGECLRILVNTAGGDGNLLLNVGPMPDGRIEPRQVRRLLEIGEWLETYGESIYATRGGPFKPGAWGASTRKGNSIYLHLLKPPGEKLILPSFKNAVVKASLLTGGEVSVTKNDDSLAITVPERHLQDIDTIVKLELDGPAANLGVIDTSIQSGSLAAGKKAKASNVFRNMNGSYGPDKALDDDPDTRWATDAGVREAWLEVSLGKRCRIAKAVICEAYAGRIKKFELQAGTGDDWKTCYRGTKIGEKGVFAFDPVSTRKVRLNILEAEEGPTICEFQLFPPGK